MSSVKRSNMAPSELGQPKAPDKWEGKNTTASTSDTSLEPAVKPQPQRDATQSADFLQSDTKISKLDDDSLEKLLNEAISYKGPKDKENSSNLFKKLLRDVELEDQARDTYPYYLSSRSDHSGNRHHTHGGSLQDLVESVNNEQLLDGDYLVGQTRRLHHHNSRYKKSSVSSRSREGGSLPSNVNVTSSHAFAYIDSFLKDNTKRKAHKNEQNIVNAAGSGLTNRAVVDSVNCGDRDHTQSTETKISHTVINIGDDEPDEIRHLLAHDSLAQGISESLGSDEGTELISLKKPRATTMSFSQKNVNVDVSIGEPSRQNYSIEKTIQFSPLLKGSSHLSDATQLNSKINAKSSGVDSKTLAGQSGKFTCASVTQKQFDENGNSIQLSKSKTKRSKADRNIKEWTVQEKEGNRGHDNIESLVAFIENKEISKKPNIINVNKNVINSDRNAKKKNASKKENAKLKKSTSMEELKSSSKIEEEIAQSEGAQISLRQKQKQSQKRNTVSLTGNGNNGSDPKETSQKGSQQSPSAQQNTAANKRGERRSWGTEELNYLGERDITMSSMARDDEKEAKKSKDSNGKDNKDGKVKVKKIEPLVLAASVESIPNTLEAAEFHVVTKKKKPKKRQMFEEATSKNQTVQPREQMTPHTNRNYSGQNIAAGKYHPSTNYTNDRDVYMKSLTTKESRRKSTSSVPPSDKSDSSDLDSIHSLPTTQTSYADIARTSNHSEKLLTSSVADRWPTVSSTAASAAKNFDSPDTSNTSTCSTLSAKSQMSGKLAAVEPNANNHPADASSIVKLASNVIRGADEKVSAGSVVVDESKRLVHQSTAAAILSGTSTKLPDVQMPISESGKNVLQKSKSVDSDKCGSMSMDQFPGLEKTVKPQKSHQNLVPVTFAASLNIATSNPIPPVPPSSVNKQPKLQSKKSPQTDSNSIAIKDTPKRQAHDSDDRNIATNGSQLLVTDINPSGIVFVQTNSKIDEAVNSECNTFTPISPSPTTKKVKKSNSQSNSMCTNNRIHGAHRPAVIICNDNDTINENVSPLLFGDFNDDILQLMKQDSHQFSDDKSNNTSSSSNCAIINQSNITIDDADQMHSNLSKLSDAATITSPQSDPGYSSAHSRSTISTDSIEVADAECQKQLATAAASDGTSIATEPKKSVNIKKTNLNKVNKTSDVVSNQSITNLGDITYSVQSNSDADHYDNLNNNIKHKNHTDDTEKLGNSVDGDSKGVNNNYSNSTHNHNNNKKTINITNTVNSKNVKSNTDSSNVQQAASHNSAFLDNSNQFKHNNQSLKTTALVNHDTSKLTSATENDITAKTNLASVTGAGLPTSTSSSSSSSSSSVTTQIASTPSPVLLPNNTPATTHIVYGKDIHIRYVDPPSAINNVANYNHEKIVNFVGLAWEDVLCATNSGGAHYYNGQ